MQGPKEETPNTLRINDQQVSTYLVKAKKAKPTLNGEAYKNRCKVYFKSSLNYLTLLITKHTAHQ